MVQLAAKRALVFSDGAQLEEGRIARSAIAVNTRIFFSLIIFRTRDGKGPDGEEGTGDFLGKIPSMHEWGRPTKFVST